MIVEVLDLKFLVLSTKYEGVDKEARSIQAFVRFWKQHPELALTEGGPLFSACRIQQVQRCSRQILSHDWRTTLYTRLKVVASSTGLEHGYVSNATRFSLTFEVSTDVTRSMNIHL